MAIDPALEAILAEANTKVEGVTVVAEHSGVTSFVPCIPGKTSDGYHTFDELYEHRCLLFCAWLKSLDSSLPFGVSEPWKSRKHDDGSSYDGWFICGLTMFNQQITYHLPDRLWDLCRATEREAAPPFDGHTSADVLERMRHWIAF